MTPNKELMPYTCKGCNGKFNVEDLEFKGLYKQDGYCPDCIDVIWQPDYQPEND